VAQSEPNFIKKIDLIFPTSKGEEIRVGEIEVFDDGSFKGTFDPKYGIEAATLHQLAMLRLNTFFLAVVLTPVYPVTASIPKS
jgi:hypothetical protein